MCDYTSAMTLRKVLDVLNPLLDLRHDQAMPAHLRDKLMLAHTYLVTQEHEHRYRWESEQVNLRE